MALPSAPRIVAWVALAASLCSPGDALGQAGGHLVVERGEGAEECPDAEALAARIAAIRSRTDLGSASYRVRFSHEKEPFVVTITAEPSGHARTLASDDATCEPVANAVALTLALLFDAEPAAPPPPTPVPPVSPPPPQRAVPTAPTPSQRLAGTITVAGANLVGVTGPAAFGVAAEAGLVVSRFRAGLGMLWTADVASSLGPGEIREGLVGGTARLCFAPTTEAFRTDLCSGLLVGRASATAHGFTRNETRHSPWVAVPLQLSGSYWTKHIGVELGLSALVQLQRADFAVEGLGVSYESAPVGFLGTLGVVGILPF